MESEFLLGMKKGHSTSSHLTSAFVEIFASTSFETRFSSETVFCLGWEG